MQLLCAASTAHKGHFILMATGWPHLILTYENTPGALIKEGATRVMAVARIPSILTAFDIFPIFCYSC